MSGTRIISTGGADPYARTGAAFAKMIPDPMDEARAATLYNQSAKAQEDIAEIQRKRDAAVAIQQAVREGRTDPKTLAELFAATPDYAGKVADFSRYLVFSNPNSTVTDRDRAYGASGGTYSGTETGFLTGERNQTQRTLGAAAIGAAPGHRQAALGELKYKQEQRAFYNPNTGETVITADKTLAPPGYVPYSPEVFNQQNKGVTVARPGPLAGGPQNVIVPQVDLYRGDYSRAAPAPTPDQVFVEGLKPQQYRPPGAPANSPNLQLPQSEVNRRFPGGTEAPTKFTEFDMTKPVEFRLPEDPPAMGNRVMPLGEFTRLYGHRTDIMGPQSSAERAGRLHPTPVGPTEPGKPNRVVPAGVIADTPLTSAFTAPDNTQTKIEPPKPVTEKTKTELNMEARRQLARAAKLSDADAYIDYKDRAAKTLPKLFTDNETEVMRLAEAYFQESGNHTEAVQKAMTSVFGEDWKADPGGWFSSPSLTKGKPSFQPPPGQRQPTVTTRGGNAAPPPTKAPEQPTRDSGLVAAQRLQQARDALRSNPGARAEIEARLRAMNIDPAGL